MENVKDWKDLMTDRIKLFVGCSPGGEDAESQMVLEYSIKKNTTIPVDIVWMRLSHDPESFWYTAEDDGWSTKTWATPFSGFRWAIPAYCNYEGKAIYCDSDFVFISDLKKLWNQEFQPDKVVMAKGGDQGWRYCLAFWNCEAAKNVPLINNLDRSKKIPNFHQRMMAHFTSTPGIVQQFQGTWNCVDGEDLPIDKIDALHYSDMSSQLHLKYALKRLKASGGKHWFDGTIRDHWRQDLKDLFDQYYHEALNYGMRVDDYVPNVPFGEIRKESQKNYRKAHKWSK